MTNSLHQPISALAMVPPMRDWQERAVAHAHQLLAAENADHMYLCAPTGTGKSRAIFEIIEALPVQGAHYLMVGMDAIVHQHRDSLVSYGCDLRGETDEGDELITPNGQRIIVKTWQSLAASARRCAPVFGKTGFLVFDECHVGGASEENVSFPLVRSHLQPQKLLYVSATTQTANQALLGEKVGHSFLYTMSQAYEDGLLNPVDLVEVHTGTQGKIIKVEKAFGQSIEQLEELSAENLTLLAGKLSEKGVSIGDAMVTRIVQHRHDVMIDLYLRRHAGEQAIFYSPSIDAAEEASERFNKKAAANGLTACTIHSELSDARGFVARFLEKKIQAIFVVGMLQEGFDMPSLALAFDCRFYRRWNSPRIARFIQKVGRVLRVDECKGVSSYYYARDIMDFYDGRGATTPDDLDLDAFNVTPGAASASADDSDFADNAAVAAALVLQEADGGDDRPAWQRGDLTIVPGEVEVHQLGGAQVRTTATKLYRLADVQAGEVAKSISFSNILGISSDKNKFDLLKLPVGCSRPSIEHNVLGRLLSNYISKSSPTFDSEFSDAIRARQPGWFSTTKDELLALPIGSACPRPRTTLARALWGYTHDKHKSFDQYFDVMIRERQPHWFVTSSQKKKSDLLAMPIGCPRPLQHRHPLGNALSSYTSPSSDTYDPDFHNAIRERQPGWFVHTRRPSERKDFLLSLELGAPLPSKEDSPELLLALRRFTYLGARAYDPDFDTVIRKRQPHWFPRGRRQKVN